MEYTKYNKAMVLLSEENQEFAAKSGQSIYGNLRIETGNNKGAMSLSVQNLRFFERNRYIYKLILFGEKKERTISAVIGNLILNRFGAGENYFRFDPGNVDGKGNKLSDFSVAIVAAVSMKDNREPLHPVLKGRVNPMGSAAAAAKQVREPVEGSTGGAKKRTMQEAVEAMKKEGKVPGISLKGVDGHKPETGNVPQGDGDSSDRAAAGAEETGEPRERACFNRFYNEYLKEMCRKTSKASEVYETIAPFSGDKTGAKWKRMANVNNLPLVSPGALWGASKYRHYIFGEDEGLYYIGIPGRFLNEEQPEGGKSGFVLWQPIVGAESLDATKAGCSLENRMSAYGYWITAIEKETGDIVEPV